MKIVFIGHRIQDLGGFTTNNLQKDIKLVIEEKIRVNSVTAVLTGLSLGIETWAAEIASACKIPYHVYIPFKDPHSKWPFEARKNYSLLLKSANKKITLDDGLYDVKKLIAKDIAMLEEADIIYSLFKNDTSLINRFSNKVINILPIGTSDDFFITI